MTGGPLSVPHHASDNCPSDEYSPEYSLRIFSADIFCRYSLRILFANTLYEYSLRMLFANTLCKYSLQILSVKKTKNTLSADLIAVHSSSAQNFSLHFQEFDVEIEFFSRHFMI